MSSNFQSLLKMIVVILPSNYCAVFSGFAILFALMEPVPWQVKFVFHVYGLGTAILGVILLSAVIEGQDSCVRQKTWSVRQTFKYLFAGRVCSSSLLCITCIWSSFSHKYR